MIRADSVTKQFFLILMVTLSVFTSDLYLSSFKEISSFFGASKVQVQLSLSVFFVGIAIFILLLPLFVQRLGKKNVLLTGLVAYLAGTAMALYTRNITFFILSRVLQAFGGAACSVISRSMAAKMPKTLTMMFVGMSISVVLAPVLGSFLLTYFGWQANFVFMLGFSILLLLATLDRKSTRLNSSHSQQSRMPSSA